MGTHNIFALTCLVMGALFGISLYLAFKGDKYALFLMCTLAAGVYSDMIYKNKEKSLLYHFAKGISGEKNENAGN